MRQIPMVTCPQTAEDDRLFIRRLAALQDRINYLSNTRVLFPNRVHKLSQLYLVLVLYKEG